MEGVISSADKHLLPDVDVDAAVQEGLGDWRPLFGVLAARFDTGDFATGAPGATCDWPGRSPRWPPSWR